MEIVAKFLVAAVAGFVAIAILWVIGWCERKWGR